IKEKIDTNQEKNQKEFSSIQEKNQQEFASIREKIDTNQEKNQKDLTEIKITQVKINTTLNLKHHEVDAYLKK
ncbi:MAG: hypothetical protein QM536_05120, partial [Chitinophagaceae bacterium]|nr:hypothetical protein [Chitinophagaceae bacterium]